MRKHATLWVATCVAFLAGCEHRVYQVEMDVEGNEIIRSISVHTEPHGGQVIQDASVRGPATGPATQAASSPSTRGAAPLWPPAGESSRESAAELAAIAAIYKVDPATSQPWKRRFVGRTPDDVGGAGQVAHFRSDMGSAWLYLERFRGAPDPASALAERLQAAETIASLLAGWARARLGNRKGFEPLGTYLEGEFPKDLKDLSLLVWMAGAARNMNTLHDPRTSNLPQVAQVLQLSSAQVDVAVLMLQYLVERRYVDLEDAPAVLRVLRGASDEDRLSFFKEHWRRFLTRKVGLTDEDLIEHLAAIFDRQQEVSESLEAYVKGSKEYGEYLTRVGRQEPSGGGPGVDEPTVRDFFRTLGTLAFMPVGVNLLNTDDELSVTLTTRAVPALTNGTWDETAGAVCWQRRMTPAARNVKDPLPAVCFAAWARADEDSQKARFGRVILKEGALLGYCIWRKGLTAGEARQWDALMERLRPATACSQLASFRSSTTQPAAAESKSAYLAAGLQMLEQAIGK